jgi:hypothetical protein
MMTLFSIRRPISYVALVSLMLFYLPVGSFAQDPRDVSPRLTNLDWKIEGNVVTVTYDLLGSVDKTYVVAVALLRENDPRFKLVPKSVSGNIGIGKFAGTGRVIVWDYRKDIPQGLFGDGYYFEVIVTEATGNSNTWLYYLLGGAAVAGGGAAYLLQIQSKSPPSAGPSSELPTPPARPTN